MTIEVNIANKLYKIPLNDIDNQKIKSFAEKLNSKIEALSHELKDQDQNTILITACLSCLSEEQNNYSNVVNKDNDLNEEDEEKYNQEDIYEIISNNYENLSEHIKILTNKVKSF